MFPDEGYELIRVVNSNEAAPRPASPSGTAVAALGDAIEVDHIDVVFVALPHIHQDQVLEIITASRRSNVEFRVVPTTTLEMIAAHIEPDQLAGIPLLRIRHGLDITPAQLAFKRAFDIGLSSLGLLMLAPIMISIALLIKVTSTGPVLIRQERVGIENRPFHMLKFRSMRVDAEMGTGPVWAAVRDARRTAIGPFLRRFSLDELPQFWNVLKGEMSLVGPRPERPVFVADFGMRIPMYAERHRVRPGLTGWAQVNDLRGMTSVEERLVYDLYYVERWSLSFDLKILTTTLFRVFTSRNAH
jgi:exopolysaccharide biosynthesis polyprenyl glycosylphosphotransferase